MYNDVSLVVKRAATVCAVTLSLAACASECVIKDGQTLVFMGDSITQYGRERAHGYPNLVVKGLKANGIDVTWHGVGICGNTSADMIKRFDKDAMSKKPDVVTISAGVNDVWFGKVTYEQFCQNMKAMTAKVKAAGAKAVLLSPTTALGEADNAGIRKFAAAVKDQAAAEGLAYAPVFEMIRDWIDSSDSALLTANTRATYDGVHMLPAGDRVMARATLKGFGLSADELAKAEAAWNSDETLVALPRIATFKETVSVNLTDAEAASVTGQSLQKILARGIASLAANPKLEVEASGAATAMTVSGATGTFSYKTYDQLLLAARQLGITVDEAIKCAVLRGVRDTKTLAPTAPVAVVNDVLTGSTVATFDVTIKSVGVTAGSCDVLLKYGTGANEGAAERVAIGANGSFTVFLDGLKPSTAYSYKMAFVNNASASKKTVLSGKFTTKAKSAALQPTNGDDTAAIQEALDMSADGTVTLGEGVFMLSDTLQLKGGVTLLGQGAGKTILRQRAAKRVTVVKEGAKLEGLTVTGGITTSNWASGAGVQLEDGTIARCRVTGNKTTGRNTFGGGVYVAKGTISDTRIDGNTANFGAGGGVGFRMGSGPVVIENCEITDNRAESGDGGGVAFIFGNPDVTIRNTKIQGNVATGKGGGLFLDAMAKKVKLEGSTISGNTANGGEADIAGKPVQ